MGVGQHEFDSQKSQWKEKAKSRWLSSDTIHAMAFVHLHCHMTAHSDDDDDKFKSIADLNSRSPSMSSPQSSGNPLDGEAEDM